MLVCRDLERAKEYGFKEKQGQVFDSLTWLEKTIEKEDITDLEVICIVSGSTGKVFLRTEGARQSFYDSSLSDLDFLYDMFKDGILEKVE